MIYENKKPFEIQIKPHLESFKDFLVFNSLMFQV